MVTEWEIVMQWREYRVRQVQLTSVLVSSSLKGDVAIPKRQWVSGVSTELVSYGVTGCLTMSLRY